MGFLPVALPHDAILFSKCGPSFFSCQLATSKIGHVGLKLLNFVLGSSPSPNNKKITHQQKGSLCIFSFSFRDLSNLKVVTSQDAPRGEGLGWDYRSSKNTTLLVVTRQHPGGGGVHIPYTLQGNEKTYPTFGKRKSSTQE